MGFAARLMLLAGLVFFLHGCSAQEGSVNALGYNVKYRYHGFQHDRYESVIMPQSAHLTIPERDQ